MKRNKLKYKKEYIATQSINEIGYRLDIMQDVLDKMISRKGLFQRKFTIEEIERAVTVIASIKTSLFREIYRQHPEISDCTQFEVTYDGYYNKIYVTEKTKQ